MKTLAAKYQGYWNYYGLIGNSESLRQFYWQTAQAAVQVAEPAEPETELHVASVQSAAEAIQSASTTDCGERTETTGDPLLLGMEAGPVTGPVPGLATDLTARA